MNIYSAQQCWHSAISSSALAWKNKVIACIRFEFVWNVKDIEDMQDMQLAQLGMGNLKDLENIAKKH